jgi:PAS domain S-box-containing protein
VLAVNLLSPLLWHYAAVSEQGLPGAMVGSIALSVLADLGLFAWAYLKLSRRYRQRLEIGITAAMDAVIAMGPRGQIVLFNPAAQAMFGYEPSAIMDRPLEVLVPERYRGEHRQQIARFLAGTSAHLAFGRNVGLLGLRANGQEFPMEGSISRIGEGSDRLVALIVRDVTVRRRALVEVERLAAVVESSSDAIISTDLDGIVSTWNAGAERMFGHSAQEMVGQPIERLVPPDRLEEERYILERIRAGERLGHFDTVRRRKDGTDIDVSVAIAPLRDETGRVVGASKIARGISEQRRAAQAQVEYVARLRELSRRLMETEEQERRRLGNELHDRTGSNLTALATTLEVIRATLPPGAAQAQAARFAECDMMLRETMEHVRHVLADLRPTALDLGLVAALRHHADRLRARTGLAIQVEAAQEIPRLGPDAEISLFRIAQEAINNALKHGDASKVTVALSTTGGELHLSVLDDGKGFDAGALPAGSSSLGMTTMRERAQAIHARVAITSAPGLGTRVAVELELGRHRAHS